VVVSATVEVGAEDASIRALPARLPKSHGAQAGHLSISYRLGYPRVGLEQKVDFAIDLQTFAREIAPARTFVLEEDIEQLRRAGFGKGANEDNTVVLTREGPRQELRLADEPARHKVLDLLGDLFFLGGRLVGRIECERSGHVLNRELVRALLNREQGIGDRIEC
jgi:UDP-3-O-acyl-N-acetylglucosamine deacetylase